MFTRLIRLLLLLMAMILTASIPAPVLAQQKTLHSTHYVKYHGAWFDIEYPKGWKARPSSRSATSDAGSDSARFTSPDGSVEFYVFSPQWNGDPKEIALNAEHEELVSHRAQRAPHGKQAGDRYLYNPVANWYTVRAKDHSYERSWVDVEDKGLNVRHVFGIKYRSKQAYQKYQTQYAHFRKSMQQFSD